MSSEINEQVYLRCTQHLLSNIRQILDKMRVDGLISRQVTHDVTLRWARDVNRLNDGQGPNGLSPLKYIAYQAFWVRKLKPVAHAWPREEVRAAEQEERKLSQGLEVVTVNEQVAIRLIIRLALKYAEENQYPSPDYNGYTIARPIPPGHLREYFRAYLQHPVKDSMPASPEGEAERHGTTLDNLIYNMRYRTFGPHHMTHILEQAIFAAHYFSVETGEGAGR